MRGLDHIVICVDDLDEAAQRYKDLGFTLTPRAKHPFGTHNCIVQLDGFFLELLTVAEPEKIPDQQIGQFGFAKFNQHYLARQQGCSMLVMDTSDFRHDNELAQQAGLDTYEPFEFSRQTTLPSGENVEVSFGLNFVTSKHMPMAGFFTCQQFQPEYFWNPVYQRHDNTAASIEEVCLVAQSPVILHSFFEAYSGCPAEQLEDNCITLKTNRGRIAILTPERFESRYKSAAPDVSTGAQLAGFTIGVKSEPLAPVSLFGTSILFEKTTCP